MIRFYKSVKDEIKANMNTQNFYVALVVTLACSLLGRYLAQFEGLRLIGHLVIALLLGMALQVFPSLMRPVREGTGYIANRFLRAGIILMGFKLNMVVLFTSGLKSLGIACIVVPFTIFTVYALCRVLKVDHTLSLLTSTGCGICGAAAVMGVSAPAKAKTDQTVLAIAIVCILGTVFTLLEIFLKPYLGLTDLQFGVWAGASLHEIAHAVAAGGAANTVGIDNAIITKLARVLLLAPVAVIVGIIEARRNKSTDESINIPIPYFMGGFILASVMGSLFPIPREIIDGLVTLAYTLLGMAMAALGINVNFKVIIEHGFKPFTAAILGSCALLVLSYFLTIYIY